MRTNLSIADMIKNALAAAPAPIAPTGITQARRDEILLEEVNKTNARNANRKNNHTTTKGNTH